MRKPPRTRRVAPAAEVLEDRRLPAGILAGVWAGQDRHDFAGGAAPNAGNGVQDIHITLSGVPAARAVASVDVLPYGGGEWDFNLRPYSTFSAAFQRAAGATTADLYVEPYRVETGREFHIVVKFDDGSSDSVNVPGGAADPNLRMPGTTATAGWVGQDGQDLTGPGPGVGPDGYIDAHLTLANLDPTSDVTGVVITRAAGLGWSAGNNTGLLNNAEFHRGTDRTRGDLVFSPDVDLNGKTLTISVTYANGKTDQTSLSAGPTNPTLAAPAPAAIPVTWNAFHAGWVGQDGLNVSGPGDVHIALDHLPAGRSIVSATLSNEAGTSWFYAKPGSGATSSDPNSRSLGLRVTTDPTKADLGFGPVRDETGATLTLRLGLDNGSTLAVRMAGGASDPGLRAPDVANTSTVAYPGDDLNDLANRFGTVRLVSGVYPMDRPLVLNKPVRIVADPGVTLLFQQSPTAPTWAAAVKVNASHTTLDGFAVRFSGSVRWAAGISYGPAVVGTTDSTDPWTGDPLVSLTFTNLDLQTPPASSSWEEAPRLFRLNTAESGRVADNRLKGGATELFNGPWLVTGNSYLGTVPNTFSYNVFAAHYTHDLTLSGNTAAPANNGGKTWRFLVMTGSGVGDTVLNNNIVGVGPMDSDTVANPNAPETILTEAYRLHYEGKVASVSPDGTVVQIYNPQADAARTGDVLSILSGPQAGQWRTIAQAINANTYVLDRPITPGSFNVSISTGFVNETYQGNTVDARGSSTADPLVLVGNHFGTKVVGNAFLGGNYAFRITAAPTESPNVWGWSHAPFLGGVIQGNTVTDSLRGGTLDAERSSFTKSGSGRVVFTATFQNNTGAWDSAFLAKRTAAGLTDPPVLVTVGNSLTADPGEIVLNASGNTVSGPANVVSAATFQVVAATLNGAVARNTGLVLPSLGTVSPAITTVIAQSVTAPETTAPASSVAIVVPTTVGGPVVEGLAVNPSTAAPSVSLAEPNAVTPTVGANAPVWTLPPSDEAGLTEFPSWSRTKLARALRSGLASVY